MNNDNRYAIMLNNFLQGQQLLSHLSMVEESTGPPHAPMWTITYKYDGNIMGIGSAPQKWRAKDMAARETLILFGVAV